MFDLDSQTGGFTATHSYLIRSSSGAILFDASKGAADWLDASQTKVDALVLTHQHFDHVINAAAIRERHKCPIFAFAPMAEDLTLVALLNGMGLPVEVPDFEVDEVLEGRDRLELAGLEFEILHVPGHSPDSLCFRPTCESNNEQKILIAGDTLFQRGIGRTDFPHSVPEQLLAAIQEKLYALPPETVVYPGHGPWTTIGEEQAENPFV